MSPVEVRLGGPSRGVPKKQKGGLPLLHGTTVRVTGSQHSFQRIPESRRDLQGMGRNLPLREQPPGDVVSLFTEAQETKLEQLLSHAGPRQQQETSAPCAGPGWGSGGPRPRWPGAETIGSDSEPCAVLPMPTAPLASW